MPANAFLRRQSEQVSENRLLAPLRNRFLIQRDTIGAAEHSSGYGGRMFRILKEWISRLGHVPTFREMLDNGLPGPGLLLAAALLLGGGTGVSAHHPPAMNAVAHVPEMPSLCPASLCTACLFLPLLSSSFCCMAKCCRSSRVLWHGAVSLDRRTSFRRSAPRA